MIRRGDYEDAVAWLQSQPHTDETIALLVEASKLVYRVREMQATQRTFPTGKVIPLRKKRGLSAAIKKDNGAA